MKNKGRLLVIDDKDQDKILQAIRSNLKGEVDLNTRSIITSSPDLRRDDDEQLDVEKLRKAIQTEVVQYGPFDLILSDFDLNEPDIMDGLGVVRIIKEENLTRGASIIMYSAARERAIRGLLKGIKDSSNENQIIEAVNKFMDYGICKFIKRESYEKEVTQFFRNRGFDMEHYLVGLLEQNEHKKFNAYSNKLKDKTFGEIAEMIEKKSDALADEWMKEILDQTIAYLLDINE